MFDEQTVDVAIIPSGILVGSPPTHWPRYGFTPFAYLVPSTVIEVLIVGIETPSDSNVVATVPLDDFHFLVEFVNVGFAVRVKLTNWPEAFNPQKLIFTTSPQEPLPPPFQNPDVHVGVAVLPLLNVYPLLHEVVYVTTPPVVTPSVHVPLSGLVQFFAQAA